VDARFFRNASGTEPVREWLKGLSKGDRYQIGEDVRYVQTRFPHVGLPVWRSLKGGLFEVRSALSGNRIARVLVCFADDRMVLLHGFIKKQRKTPQDELDLAKKRRKLYQQSYEQKNPSRK